MTLTHDQIEELINELEEQGKGLSKWEDSFLESVSDQFDQSGWLSVKQQETLKGIHAERVLGERRSGRFMDSR